MTSVRDLFELTPTSLTTTVYRYHNPNWAFNPISGEGARLTGGRFNPKGISALYTSFEPGTALQEMTGSTSSKLIQPMLLCSYQVLLKKVIDLRPYDSLFVSPWRQNLLSGNVPPGHEYANHIVLNNLADAIIVPSYQAKGKSNLVIYQYDKETVRLNDIDERLKTLFGSQFVE